MMILLNLTDLKTLSYHKSSRYILSFFFLFLFNFNIQYPIYSMYKTYSHQTDPRYVIVYIRTEIPRKEISSKLAGKN